MKIIEAMKKVKANKEKILDLQRLILSNAAHLSIETPMYADADTRVRGWAQACEDLARDNVALLTSIARTNLATKVTIDLDGQPVTKTIAEWVWRRREYAQLDMTTWSHMNDRNLKEGKAASSTGVDLEIKIVRHYDPATRDAKIARYKGEPHAIDAALEVVNATTDLVTA